MVLKKKYLYESFNLGSMIASTVFEGCHLEIHLENLAQFTDFPDCFWMAAPSVR
jgi:hypothetical protein